jgi:glycosyltransferase involved in cell wall biosynthesis
MPPAAPSNKAAPAPGGAWTDADHSGSDAPFAGPVTLVAYEGVADNDVVKGQLFGLAAELDRREVPTAVIVFERFDRYGRGRSQARAFAATCAQVRVVVVPRLPGPLGLRVASFASALMLAGATGVVHARGMKSAMLARGARGVRLGPATLVLDLRGAEPEEVADLMDRGERPERGIFPRSRAQVLERLERVERAAVTAADHIVCVSQALADHVERKYALEPSHVSVVHGAADAAMTFSRSSRASVRLQLGAGDDLVLCYLGRLSPVHRPDYIASIAARIAGASAVRVVLLVLTRDADVAAALADRLSGDVEVIAIGVDQEAVGAYLSAADLGLLMLDDAPRNRVSFPIKFSEYSCCGLPVIATAAAADPAAHIRAANVGAVIVPIQGGEWRLEWPEGGTLEAALGRIASVTAEQRTALAASAAQEMRFDHTVDQLLRCYAQATAGQHGARSSEGPC